MAHLSTTEKSIAQAIAERMNDCSGTFSVFVETDTEAIEAAGTYSTEGYEQDEDGNAVDCGYVEIESCKVWQLADEDEKAQDGNDLYDLAAIEKEAERMAA